MIRPIPKVTAEDNSLYEFKTGTDTLKYSTKIVIDELNDNLLLGYDLNLSEFTSCSCPNFGITKKNCKHIKECLDYLKNVGIEFREVESVIPD